jgi:hypothetical protein
VPRSLWRYGRRFLIGYNLALREWFHSRDARASLEDASWHRGDDYRALVDNSILPDLTIRAQSNRIRCSIG